tara:strand:+ start:642 stop:998 length:357 start_codon:yes stop_codon:yes gene_type:complete
MRLLVHVEVAFEDPLLHGVRNLGLLRHLAGRWLHYGDALGSLMTVRTEHWGRTGHGASLGSGTEVLREVVAFACGWRCQYVIVKRTFRMLCNMLCDGRPDVRDRGRSGRPWGERANKK